MGPCKRFKGIQRSCYYFQNRTVKEKTQDTVWSLLNLVRASVDRSEIILYVFFALVFPSKVSQTFAP